MDARGNNAPLIAAGGGLLLFVSLFLKWFLESSAWQLFDFTDVVLAIIALIGIVVGGSIAAGNALHPPGGPGSTVYTSGLIAFAVVATYIFEGEERKIGLFIALIAAVAMIVGGLGLRDTTATNRTRTPREG